MTTPEPAALVPASGELVSTETPLHALLLAFAGLDTQRQQMVAAKDLDGLAHGLQALRELAAELRTLIRDVEADVYGLMDARKVEIDGVGVLERRKATDRKQWRWDDLLTDALAVLIAKHEGSTLDAFGELVTMLPLTGSTQPRLTELRSFGLDDDLYCESSPGKVSVQIHGQVER